MFQKKSFAIVVVVLSVIVGLTVFVMIQNPPVEQETDVRENEQTEEEATFLEQTFANIDPSVSKELVLRVDEMDNREPADDIANTLLQHEGLIGRVTADLQQKIFTIEYDSAKLEEENLLQTVNSTGYTIKKASQPPPSQ